MRWHRSKKSELKHPVFKLFIYLMLILGTIVMLLPFYWLVRSSLLTRTQIFIMPPIWIPNPPIFANYLKAMTSFPFGRYFMNSAIIVILTISGTIITGTLGAFAFARLRWPGRDILFGMTIATLMLPYAAVMIPTFILWKTLGAVNTYAPLTIPWWFGGGPFNLFLLRQFFKRIPQELDEAAYIDGASVFNIYSKIILPLSKPVLIVVGLFQFIFVWNDFLGPVIYLMDADLYTVALGLTQFLGIYGGYWHLLMAASTIATFPAIVIFFIGQRYFIKGIALAGIKG